MVIKGNGAVNTMEAVKINTKEKERTTRELFQSEIIKTGRWSNTSPTVFYFDL